MNWLFRRIEDLEKTANKNRMSMALYSTKWIIDKLKTPTKYFQPIKSNMISKGKFYFLFYDLDGKSSKLEKYSFVLVCDIIDMKNKKKIYGLSLNFLPLKIRIYFFNYFFNFYEQTLNKNAEMKDVLHEDMLPGVNLKYMYKLLESIGFEYVIREFDSTKINKGYEISVLDVDKLLTCDSSHFTGVDEKKLAQIWLSKLEKKEDRTKKLKESLIKDYKSFEKESNDAIKNIDDSVNNLGKSFNQIQNFLQNI